MDVCLCTRTLCWEPAVPTLVMRQPRQPQYFLPYTEEKWVEVTRDSCALKNPRAKRKKHDDKPHKAVPLERCIHVFTGPMYIYCRRS